MAKPQAQALSYRLHALSASLHIIASPTSTTFSPQHTQLRKSAVKKTSQLATHGA